MIILRLEAQFLGPIMPTEISKGGPFMQDIGVRSDPLIILHWAPLSLHQREVTAKGVVLRHTSSCYLDMTGDVLLHFVQCRVMWLYAFGLVLVIPAAFPSSHAYFG